MDELPEEIRERLSRELTPGETVAWCAQPLPRPVPRGPFLLIAITFSYVLTMVMGAVVIIKQGADASGPLWATLAITGLGMLVLAVVCWLWGRHNLRRAAARTCYCVTNRRVVILDNGFCGTNGPSVLCALSQSPHRTERRSLTPVQIDDLRCTESDDGSGDLLLCSVLVQDSDGDKVTSAIGFYSVPRVREAETAVRRLIGGGTMYAEQQAQQPPPQRVAR